MGRNIAKQVEEKIDIDTNYTNQERIDIIGQKIASVCDRKDLIFHFKVLDEEDVKNAFALPGGYIYVFKDLIRGLEDDEVAAILAHEIGHVCARHSIKRLHKGLGYQIMSILVVAGAKDAYTKRKAQEAFGHLMLANTREDELEADKLAVKYLKKAGYDPEAVVKVVDKLIKWQMDSPPGRKRYWYTHPYLAARRSAANQAITGEISFDDYMNVTEDEGYVIPR
ncbi:MAG: M48 family metalloprotease [Candidatus Omnitrophica bacterium]|nr:M48 family metalloprotease [Candidatus Omnitrophota bacterium]